MESFWRRLKYYGVGFLGGLVFVFVFFQNRGCSWLPANRVKNSLLDRVIVLSDEQQVKLSRMGLTLKDVKAALNDGDVEFSESKKKGKLKVYKITHSTSAEPVEYFFTMPDESFISEVHLGAKNAESVKNTIKGKGRIIHLPNDKNLVFIDSTQQLFCQKSKLKIKNALVVLDGLKLTGQIDFAKTTLTKQPKAVHLLSFYSSQLQRRIEFESVWYKNKIDVTRFVDSTLGSCP
jgi:hypothetical protein